MSIMKISARACVLVCGMLLLSACNITPGTPYPTGYTGGPPPIVYNGGGAAMEKMECGECAKCCKDGHSTMGGKCCKKGTCPISLKDIKGNKKKNKIDHSAHHGHHAPTATGSAYDAVMADMHAAMAAAPVTGDVDTDFAAGMIPHHQGAIDMAEVLLEQGDDPKLRRLAREIIVAQKREIAFMKYWLETRGETPASNIVNVRPHH